MEFCIRADQLRAALKDIEAAEANGFMYCEAVFYLASAGRDLGSCQAAYSDLSERAKPNDPAWNWGRFQGVTRRNRWDGKGLVPITADGRAEHE